MNTTNKTAEQPKLLDQLRRAVRVRNYSIRTERSYVDWVYRYIVFHNKRHPAEMGAREITAFLTHLAVEGNVAAMGTRQTTMETVADAWLRKDRAAAMAWIKKGLLPKRIEDRLLQSN